MSDVTDKMVEVARNVLAEATFGGVAPPSSYVRAAIAAVLTAAPAVDSDLWCEHREYVFPTGLRHPDRHGFNPCPGPHHQLLVGPEVKS